MKTDISDDRVIDFFFHFRSLTHWDDSKNDLIFKKIFNF